MFIRPLENSDDLLAVSRIYEEGWKFAYHGIVPQAFLDSIPVGHWADRITRYGYHNLLLLDDDIPVGASAYCPARMKEYAGFGEVVSLYLLPEYVGKGCGRQLLEAACDALAARGFQDVYLWVLEENDRARRFYERFGFHDAGVIHDVRIGGKPLRELQYRYHTK